MAVSPGETIFRKTERVWDLNPDDSTVRRILAPIVLNFIFLRHRRGGIIGWSVRSLQVFFSFA